jgi:hypothetical protein
MAQVIDYTTLCPLGGVISLDLIDACIRDGMAYTYCDPNGVWRPLYGDSKVRKALSEGVGVVRMALLHAGASA